MAKENIVKVVIHKKKLLCELFMGHARYKLQNSLLHGSACTVQFLARKQVMLKSVKVTLSH